MTFTFGRSVLKWDSIWNSMEAIIHLMTEIVSDRNVAVYSMIRSTAQMRGTPLRLIFCGSKDVLRCDFTSRTRYCCSEARVGNAKSHGISPRCGLIHRDRKSTRLNSSHIPLS